MMIHWNDTDELSAACPVCDDKGAKRIRLSIKSTVPPHDTLRFARCRQCETAFVIDFPAASYEESAGGEAALAFYLEQGAGVDVMADASAAIDPTSVHRYVEIGCGFGFSLDFARFAHGWSVRGIDPGSNARAGREALDLDIIQGYFRSAEDVGEPPADLILCSEVIEHIQEPSGFLQALRRALAPEGTLMLTTPNAKAMEPDAPQGTLLPLLSPGYHAILYSQQSLAAVLRRAGFSSVIVRERGPTLVAAAAATSHGVDFNRRLDRSRYLAYLAERAMTTDASSPLGIGFRYRYLKELVNAGAYEKAAGAADALAHACRQRWAIDLAHPEGLLNLGAAPFDRLADYHKAFPFCLCGILYNVGMLEWQHKGMLESARHYFLAAADAGERTRATLQRFGFDDGETDHLTWRARANAVRLLSWLEPRKVPEAVLTFGNTASSSLREIAPASLCRETQGDVFITLVNLGHYQEADRLAEAVAATSLELDDLLDANISFALGMLDLNHKEAYLAGSDKFARAHRISEHLLKRNFEPVDAPPLWSALYHQAFAFVLAGDATKASEAAKGILTPRSEPWLPPIPDMWRARTLALVEKHNLSI